MIQKNPIGKEELKQKAGLIFPFLLLFVCFLIRHTTLYTECGDDWLFRKVLTGQSEPIKALYVFIVDRYRTWSSRLLIEIAASVITHFPVFWIVADSAILSAIPFLILRLLYLHKQKAVIWTVCACMLLFPIEMFEGAGWIATTLNYSWPLFGGLISLLPFSLIYNGEQVPQKQVPLYILSLLVGCNNEQLCLFLIGVSFLASVLIFVKSQKVYRILIFEHLLMLLSMVFILTCPGNHNRILEETQKWFPGYRDLSIPVRFEIGFSATGYALVMSRNLLFATFCFFILLNVWQISINPFKRVCAAIPMFSCTVLGLLPEFFTRIIPHFMVIREKLSETGTGFNIHDLSTCIPDLFLLLIFFCIEYCLYYIFKEHGTFRCSRSVFAVLLFAIGLGTHVMMGFSPTIWASGERTMCYLQFTLVALIAMLTERI